MLIFVLMGSLVVLVSGNSRGIGVPCDVNIDVGSDDVNTPSSANMWWAAKTVWAGTKHTLRTGDDKAVADPTSYIANQWTDIYMRTHERKQQWTGLVLYAENADKKKVGQWIIPAGAPFWQPGECVVHKNANQKSYLNTFRFSAPAGTGTVTIKALVKYGLANPVKDGAFYWPNSQHLTLTEAAATSAPAWFEGLKGESCDQVCTKVSGSCDITAMKATGQSVAMYQSVKALTSCTLPLMAGCSGASPAVSDSGCFYHDESCEPPPAPVVPTKTCTQDCGQPFYGNQGAQIGDCCNAVEKPDMKGFCWCVVELGNQNGVYSEHNGKWAKGAQADDTKAPTPEPPKKEEITCAATVNWETDDNARRICACTGASNAALPTPGANAPTSAGGGGGGGGPMDNGQVMPTPPTTPYPSFSPTTRRPTAAGETFSPTRAPTQKMDHFPPSSGPRNHPSFIDDQGAASSKSYSPAALIITMLVGAAAVLGPSSSSAASLGPSSASSKSAGPSLKSPRRSSVSSTKSFSIMLISLVLVVFFAPVSQAHNWMTSPARGNEAGENNGFNGFTSPPCPQKSARIHTQVGRGQKFPVEWAAGHGFGSFTYFAVMKASDEKEMAKHDFDLFDDYLAKDTAGGTTYLAEYPVHHVSHTPHSNSLLEPTELQTTYTWVPDQPATKGNRPVGFRNFGDNPSVKKKTVAARSMDRRSQYKSATYPWLISVHKFVMRYDYPEDSDTTMMEIPAAFDAGSYVIQYSWSGYYDCIDVNVLDVKSTDIFGSGGGTTGFDRIDHCEYIDSYQGYAPTTCKGISASDGISACEGLCRDAGCDAIQVVQTSLDPLVVAAGVWTGKDHVNKVCAAALTSEFVCFGLKQGTPQVGPTYQISADPEDPYFYNSCFKKSAGWTFRQTCATCPATTIEPGSRFGPHCITCDAMRNNARQDGIIPKWEINTANQQCRHCDNLG